MHLYREERVNRLKGTFLCSFPEVCEKINGLLPTTLNDCYIKVNKRITDRLSLKSKKTQIFQEICQKACLKLKNYIAIHAFMLKCGSLELSEKSRIRQAQQSITTTHFVFRNAGE